MTISESSGPASGGATRPFDAVLCDVDNVIRFYDSTRLTGLERRAGLPEGATSEVAFAPERDGPLMRGRITPAQWVESVTEGLTGAHGLPAERAHELASALAGAPFAADDGTVDALREARAAGLTLVLVTNATLDLEDDLETMGLTGLADHVVSSARVGVVKPDREIYEIALARAGTPPARCLFVDDRRENVEAAEALGMTGVHYRRPADLRDALGFLD
ncbi:HAD family hydrolase [Streptomyces sp. NPDC058623]|uniref:HAD family hydrolase n=1 Tax=Streptomyces sp. NPDC058623 TaxID=3346563 RepID=UPI00364E4C7C